MILTAHQPVYLPWIGLFHKIALADQFVIFDTVQYLKKDWNNRNQIKTAQGPIWLTVPVLTHGKFNQSLLDVVINNTVNWRKKHLKSIETNYRKAPFFSRYIDFFKRIYEKEWEKLVDLNDAMLKYFLKELSIDVEIIYGHDLNLKGCKTDLVLDMCKKMNASLYIFGILGKDYAELDKFDKAGIRVMFQNYTHPVYPQLWGDFVSNLSIIDLLFNIGSEKASRAVMDGNVTQNDLKGVAKI